MPIESIREKDLIKSLGLDFETSWANGTVYSKWDENYENVLQAEDWV